MITLVLIGVVTFLFFIYFRHKYSYWERKGIPSPKAYPFIVTLLAETALSGQETEEKFIKDYGPVFGTYSGVTPVFNTSDVNHIKTILGDLITFPVSKSIEFNDRYIDNSMFFKSGLDWKTARAAQTYFFTSKRFRNLLGHFDKVTSIFLDNVKDLLQATTDGELEVKELPRYLTLDIIMKIVFAIDINSFKEKDSTFVKDFLNIGKLNLIQAFFIGFLPKSVSKFLGLNFMNVKALNNSGDHFKKILRERRKSGIKYNDLSELIQDAVDNGKVKLTEDEVIGNVIIALLAGLHPVSMVITLAFDLLAKHRDVQQKLYNEIRETFDKEISYENLNQSPYLDAFVNETLRFANITQIISRSAAVDTKLDGIEIEKNTEINVIIYGPHMSSANYANPREFNPDRFLKNSSINNKDAPFFAPFGLGHKVCLGQRLALMEVKYLLVRFLPKYEIIEAKDPNYKIQSFRRFWSIESLNIGLKERNL